MPVLYIILSVLFYRMLNNLVLIGMDQHQILSGMEMMSIWMIQLKLASQRLNYVVQQMQMTPTIF